MNEYTDLPQWNVSDLVSEIKNAVEYAANTKVIKVTGEVSDCKLARGTMYITLKDTDNSVLPVVIWSYEKRHDFKISTGDSLSITGNLTIFRKSGKYQLQGYKAEKAGIGELYKEYMMLKEKYEKEGLFDESRKKKLPKLIKNVGVITALKGAALQDFLYVLNKNKFGGSIRVKGCYVQGSSCPKSVAKNIEYMDNLQLDVIVVTRGGGSFEDLFGFSDKLVIDAISNATTCVISAIGHEVDTMLSDLVADYRAPTPSIAGEVIANSYKSSYDDIIKIDRLLKTRVKSKIMENVHKLHQKFNTMKMLLGDKDDIIDCYQNRVSEIKQKMDNIFSKELHIYQSRVSYMINILKVNHPNKILSKGYCIVDKDGKVIDSVKQFKKLSPEKLTLTFADGRVNITLSHAE